MSVFLGDDPDDRRKRFFERLARDGKEERNEIDEAYIYKERYYRRALLSMSVALKCKHK